jgi:hypothetical protein
LRWEARRVDRGVRQAAVEIVGQADEPFDGEPFHALAEAQVVTGSWRRHRDTVHPHPSRGRIASAWARSAAASSRRSGTSRAPATADAATPALAS